ncbi:hypothetical protein YC2023_075080 [Brassica napus]
MTIAYALMSSSPYHTQALWLLFITSNTLPPLSAKLASDLSMATRVCGAPHLSLWQDLKLQHCIQALWSMVFTRHSLACSSALISTVDLSSDVYGITTLCLHLHSNSSFFAGHLFCSGEDTFPSQTCITSHTILLLYRLAQVSIMYAIV